MKWCYTVFFPLVQKYVVAISPGFALGAKDEWRCIISTWWVDPSECQAWIFRMCDNACVAPFNPLFHSRATLTSSWIYDFKHLTIGVCLHSSGMHCLWAVPVPGTYLCACADHSCNDLWLAVTFGEFSCGFQGRLAAPSVCYTRWTKSIISMIVRPIWLIQGGGALTTLYFHIGNNRQKHSSLSWLLASPVKFHQLVHCIMFGNAPGTSQCFTKSDRILKANFNIYFYCLPSLNLDFATQRGEGKTQYL